MSGRLRKNWGQSLYDQRDVERSLLPLETCDAGALERTASHVPTPIFADGFLQGDDEAWSDSVP